jgi:hypothetical protein
LVCEVGGVVNAKKNLRSLSLNFKTLTITWINAIVIPVTTAIVIPVTTAIVIPVTTAICGSVIWKAIPDL